MKSLTTIEKAYIRLGSGSYDASIAYRGEGLEQFREHQSKGIVPEHPHSLYDTLSIGKKRRDIMVKEIREDYFEGKGTGHWLGLHGFVMDWSPELWMIPILLPWHEKAQELQEVWIT